MSFWDHVTVLLAITIKRMSQKGANSICAAIQKEQIRLRYVSIDRNTGRGDLFMNVGVHKEITGGMGRGFDR